MGRAPPFTGRVSIGVGPCEMNINHVRDVARAHSPVGVTIPSIWEPKEYLNSERPVSSRQRRLEVVIDLGSLDRGSGNTMLFGEDREPLSIRWQSFHSQASALDSPSVPAAPNAPRAPACRTAGRGNSPFRKNCASTPREPWSRSSHKTIVVADELEQVFARLRLALWRRRTTRRVETGRARA
jgi:hypothetical protein